MRTRGLLAPPGPFIIARHAMPGGRMKEIPRHEVTPHARTRCHDDGKQDRPVSFLSMKCPSRTRTMTTASPGTACQALMSRPLGTKSLASRPAPFMGPTSAETISFTPFHQVIHNGNPKQFAGAVVEHPILQGLAQLFFRRSCHRERFVNNLGKTASKASTSPIRPSLPMHYTATIQLSPDRDW